jgi:hypothetical protein
MTYLTLLTALLLSGIAAYYSVIGLTAIFSGAFWSIVIMGSVLEVGKLVTASWLYRNWKECPFLLKSYLTSAVVILMVITSMGIFGFLSKAHIDSTLTAGANNVEIRTLNQQEKIAKERLDYLLKRAGDPETASARIDRQIQQTQKELTDINKRRLPLLQEENKLMAEVGPIKYVGDLIYGEDDPNGIDKAIGLVILFIMVVFDPLAVLLLIAANMSIRQNEKEKAKKEVKESIIDIPVFVPKKEDVVEVPKDNLTDIESVEDEKEIKEFFDKAKKTAQELDAGTFDSPKEETIIIDAASNESIPPLNSPGVEVKVKSVGPGQYQEEIVSNKKIEPKYDYDAEFGFKEKK